MMDELQIFDVKMYASGEALPEEQTALAVIAMILGTLFAVVVVFTTIYVCYMGPLKDYNFSKRFVTLFYKLTQQYLSNNFRTYSKKIN